MRTPDTILVAVTRVDGGLTMLRVVTAEYEPDGAGGRRKRWEIDPTPEYIAGIIAKHEWAGPQAPVSWRIVADDFVGEATDRTFRNAWRDGNTAPDVDMVKARDIHRDQLRVMRAPLLETLDSEYLRADETGNTAEKQRIAAVKQLLRAVTDDPAIEAAQTPDVLKAVIPAPLKGVTAQDRTVEPTPLGG